MPKRDHADPYSETDRPRDLDELRHRLNRRVANEVGQWRHCPAAACRRNHRCLSKVDMCTTAGEPPVDMTAEEEARMMAEFGRALRQRLDALEANKEPQNVEDRQNVENREERRSAPDRTRAGKAGRSAHRKKAGGAP